MKGWEDRDAMYRQALALHVLSCMDGWVGGWVDVPGWGGAGWLLACLWIDAAMDEALVEDSRRRSKAGQVSNPLEGSLGGVQLAAQLHESCNDSHLTHPTLRTSSL